VVQLHNAVPAFAAALRAKIAGMGSAARAEPCSQGVIYSLKTSVWVPGMARKCLSSAPLRVSR
jgi:hypothetical protein